MSKDYFVSTIFILVSTHSLFKSFWVGAYLFQHMLTGLTPKLMDLGHFEANEFLVILNSVCELYE